MASVFLDKKIVPDDDMVKAALSDTYSLWKELQEHTNSVCPDVFGEWKHYSKASGFTFQVKSKKRALYYFVPKSGYFSITFVLGGRAALAAQKAPLSSEIISDILAATQYAEGRSVAVDVFDAVALEYVKELLKIKCEN